MTRCEQRVIIARSDGLGRLLAFIALLSVTLLSGTGLAAGAEDGTEPSRGWTILEQRAGEGEQCLVCGKQIYGEDVVEIRYQGRVFHVGAPLLPDFDADPDRYFAKLQARSVLFDEASISPKRASMGWLIFGGYVLLGLVSGAMCGYLAIAKALSPLPWFFAGFVGNVVALGLILAAPAGDKDAFSGGIPAGLRKVRMTRNPVRCPKCGAGNHPASRTCGGCDAALTPAVQPETQRV